MSDLNGFFENAFANHEITSCEFERMVFENPKDGAFYAELVTARGTLCVVGDGPDMMVRHHGHGRDVAKWVRWIASQGPHSYYLQEKILGETREWDLAQALADAEAYSKSESGWALTPEKLEEAP